MTTPWIVDVMSEVIKTLDKRIDHMMEQGMTAHVALAKIRKEGDEQGPTEMFGTAIVTAYLETINGGSRLLELIETKVR